MLRTVTISARQGGKRLLASQRDAPAINLEQVRTTVIVERKFPIPLAPKGCLPFVKQRHRVYKVVGRVHDKPTPNITCILTDFVDGVGIRGDTVTVKTKLFRGRLYPAGLTVYASPENIDKFAKEKVDNKEREEEKRLGVFGQMTLKQLSGLYLPVYMSGDNQWILTPKHIRLALRRAGVETKEDCVLLPQEAITGPGEFKFRITVNGVRSTEVKGCVVLTYKDPSKNVPVDLPKLWTSTNPLKNKQHKSPDQESSSQALKL